MRTWPFKGIRRECFILADASCEKGNTKFNRTLFATLKFNKNYFLTGPDKDQLGVCSAHLHYGCASGSKERGNELRQIFWDNLARGIVNYKTRILCIDADRALPIVAPELRARGISIFLASFFPCLAKDDHNAPMLESAGIFVIGPTAIFRPTYSPTTLGAQEANYVDKDKDTQDRQKDEDCEVHVFSGECCPGRRFSSYMPQYDGEKRKLYLTLSVTPVRTVRDQAMRIVLREKKNDNNNKFGGYDHMDRHGDPTFEWPALHAVNQKPFDPWDMECLINKNLFGHGAMMTLAMIISMPGGGKPFTSALQRSYYNRPQANAGITIAQVNKGWRGKGPAAVAAAHSCFKNPSAVANQVWLQCFKNPSAVAEGSLSAYWDCCTHHIWRTWAKDSSAVAEESHSHPTSHGHPGQGWYEKGWKGGGKSHETSNAERRYVLDVQSSEEEDDGGENDDEIRVSLPVWEFVAKIPNPEWCWNNHIDNIEYNRRTGEYRYTTLDPWHEQYAWA